MLECGHEREPFGAPICAHLRSCREPWISYVRWYTGSGMASELVCHTCVQQRESGSSTTTAMVCQECFEYAISEVGDLDGVRGQPEVRTRDEPFETQLRITELPNDIGAITDVCPLTIEGNLHWLLLTQDGLLAQLDANDGASRLLTSVVLPSEPNHEPWCGRILKPRLHTSPSGQCAAIVNDYGRFGKIVELRSGRVTLELDGGDYHSETVPFSFDMSDPLTGNLLTRRNPTSYQKGQNRPEHYLDYFHGAIHVSPTSARIADDGWAWHPCGMPTTWSLEEWASHNVWESEDGPTRGAICYRDYYWDHGMTWLGDNVLAVGGLGEDDVAMIDGARIFEIVPSAGSAAGAPVSRSSPHEIRAFAGPAGSFFSDGQYLFSSDQNGLSRWDVSDGSRTGHLPGFKPTHFHRSAREFAQVVDGTLVRCKM
jgi:hypothetical protein